MEPMRDQIEDRQQELPPKMAKDFSEEEDWPGYFGAVTGKGPRETLVFALDLFEKEGRTDGFAVDIAAGEGRDTVELLKRGWRVVATDNHPEAFEFLGRQVPEDSRSRLKTVQADFCDMEIPSCDLVNASFALPFCEPGHFPGLWSRIIAAIPTGGRFAGQFFGKEDTWASLPSRTHHSQEKILELLEGFEIEMMRVEERDDPPDVRNPKHWQLFHVVARRM
jgi:tellurite methyltransferase